MKMCPSSNCNFDEELDDITKVEIIIDTDIEYMTIIPQQVSAKLHRGAIKFRKFKASVSDDAIKFVLKLKHNNFADTTRLYRQIFQEYKPKNVTFVTHFTIHQPSEGDVLTVRWVKLAEDDDTTPLQCKNGTHYIMDADLSSRCMCGEYPNYGVISRFKVGETIVDIQSGATWRVVSLGSDKYVYLLHALDRSNVPNQIFARIHNSKLHDSTSYEDGTWHIIFPEGALEYIW